MRDADPAAPVPGYDICVLDDEANTLPVNTGGNICVWLPLPAGVAWSICNNNQRFVGSYLSEFNGYYLTGDGGFKGSEGYIFITGRTDDVINVAGHRLSTGDRRQSVTQDPLSEDTSRGIAQDCRR